MITNEPSHLSKYSHIDVAVYFSGSMGNIYQLKQWLMPFKQLDQAMPLLLIIRDTKVYKWVKKHTDFSAIHCKTMDALLALYEAHDFKCILYVNNASTNFQSLMNNAALHVHINHGESEKSSTFSNRAKAYDAVFIVSDAAYDRYEKNLINITMERFIRIGRPQLDWVAPITAPETDRKVVLYAPTWEGTHLSMNYSSIPEYGEYIVDSILSNKNYFLVYRPHPHTGSRDKNVAALDKAIRKKITQSDYATAIDDGDINAIFQFTEIAIFDNSAVAIDFLHYDKPMLMTDYFYRIKNRQSQPKVVEACTLLDKYNIHKLLNIVASELQYDELKQQRHRVQNYFLGQYAEGESTQAFISEVAKVIQQRNVLIKQLEHKKSTDSSTSKSVVLQ
jgi:CDP-glycerol glycerophosphotransferase (TagB/SpsB family)